jgi:hypothetical protein
MDHNHARRPHYHRGRRGPERRGGDRRAPQTAEPPARSSADQVDVEQIMRDIRARISQRHGIELSAPQIHELAARRLEAILEPRNINPSLLEQLRKGAAAPPGIAPAAPDPGYAFEDTTLYASHRGLLRVIRRLLNPLLKLFFNPNPLVHALHTQSRLNREAAAREAERERTQSEWNALHYEVLRRLVTEVSRVSIEMQTLSQRVESLSARVDFNDRRVRAIEGATTPRAQRPEAVAAQATPTESRTSEVATDAQVTETTRRRRRRRRGRRGGTAAPETGAVTAAAGELAAADGPEDEDEDGDDGTSEAGGDAGAERLLLPASEPPGTASEPAAVSTAPEPGVPPPPVEPAAQPTPPRDEPSAPAAEVPGSEPPER